MRRVAAVLMWASMLALCSSAFAQLDPRQLAEEAHAEGGYADELRIRGSEGGVSSFPQSQNGGGNSGGDSRRFDNWGRGDASDRTTAPGGRGQAPPPDFNFGGALGGQAVSTILMIGVGVLMIALVIVLFIALRGDRKNPPPVRRPKMVSAARPEELPWDIGDPDELAAQGRYSEAILAVLVGSLKAVGWKPRGERSRTAREVLWSIPYSDARRQPLDEVVRRAERVRFAGEVADMETFQEVRQWGESVRSASS